MAKQERVQKERARHDVEREEEAVEAVVADKTDAAALKEEMDDILDEIDSVLEKNAAEFVAAYVQKGGE